MCLVPLALVATTASGCRRPLFGTDVHGWTEKSADGGTFLDFANDPELANCVWEVDGKKWPHPPGVPGPIKPGKHVVGGSTTVPGPHGCGGIEIEVKPGTVRTIDYFGP